MATLIIESSNPQNMKLIAELAKRLGERVKSIAPSEAEDLLLGDWMDSVKTHEYVDRKEIYRRFP